MKPLAFNLKDAKKVAGDKMSSTFRLLDGHEIRVAHAPLPALQRKQLEKLPVYMESGGDPSDTSPEALTNRFQDINFARNAAESDQQNALPTSQELTDRFAAIDAEKNPSPESPGPTILTGEAQKPTTEIPAPETASKIPDAGAPVVDPSNASLSSLNGGANIPGLVAQGQKGIKQEADVEAQIAQANANTEQNNITAQQELMDAAKKNASDFQAQQKQFLQDYQNGHIDPKHYIESMDSAQKVSTAIGLFLGGWSSAYTHQGNPALEFLNKQIDRDIEAQRSRLDQQKTILGANQELYHDNVLANNATRMQLNDIYGHEISLNAAKLGTPKAEAQKNLALSKFGIENQGLLYQNAIRATALHALQNGGAGLDPATLGNAQIIDPEQAKKEQVAFTQQKESVKQGNQIYDQLARLQTVASRVGSPFQSASQIGVLNGELASLVQQANPSERLTPESAKLEIEPYFITLKDNPASVAVKRQAFNNHLQSKFVSQMPYFAKYAPAALPGGQSGGKQYQVGQVIYIGGKKAQITNAQGDYQLIK